MRVPDPTRPDINPSVLRRSYAASTVLRESPSMRAITRELSGREPGASAPLAMACRMASHNLPRQVIATIGLHPASPESPKGRGGMSIGLELSCPLEEAMHRLEAKGVRFGTVANEGKRFVIRFRLTKRRATVKSITASFTFCGPKQILILSVHTHLGDFLGRLRKNGGNLERGEFGCFAKTADGSRVSSDQACHRR